MTKRTARDCKLKDAGDKKRYWRQPRGRGKSIVLLAGGQQIGKGGWWAGCVLVGQGAPKQQ